MFFANVVAPNKSVKIWFHCYCWIKLYQRLCQSWMTVCFFSISVSIMHVWKIKMYDNTADDPLSTKWLRKVFYHSDVRLPTETKPKEMIDRSSCNRFDNWILVVNLTISTCRSSINLNFLSLENRSPARLINSKRIWSWKKMFEIN